MRQKHYGVGGWPLCASSLFIQFLGLRPLFSATKSFFNASGTPVCQLAGGFVLALRGGYTAAHGMEENFKKGTATLHVL